MLVQVDKCLQNLIEEALRLLLGQRLIAMLLHVLLQIELQVLEHEVQLVLRVDDLFQPMEERQCKFRLGRFLMYTYSTTLGCLRPLSKLISRMAVDGTPSSSFSNLIFFKATH